MYPYPLTTEVTMPRSMKKRIPSITMSTLKGARNVLHELQLEHPTKRFQIVERSWGSLANPSVSYLVREVPVTQVRYRVLSAAEVVSI